MPEVWKRIPGFEWYEVSSYGAVRKNKPGEAIQVLKQSVGPTGYLRVGIRNAEKARCAQVHALVLETFVGPRPVGQVCCHNDCTKTNNKLENLRWDTPAENNRQNPGKAVRKFTKQEVHNFRVSAKTHTQLAKENGVSISHMANIRNGERYGA